MHHPKDLKALHKRLIFSIAVSLLSLWQAIDHIGWLHGWLLSERRTIDAHWVGSERRRLRPINLLFPVTIAQMILFVFGLQLQPAEALITISAGNLAFAGVIMLPAAIRKKSAFAQNI